MKFFSARKILGVFLVISLFFSLGSSFRVYAQTPTPDPNAAPTPTVATSIGLNAQWAFDPETTEVGKNADRARQLLWWVFSHPPVYWAPVLASVWAFSRNVVYVFVVLVLVAMGLGMILSRRGTVGPIFSGISSPFGGLNIINILFKLAMILIYVTFSYLFILALIQMSEISMRFFIENVGGRDLFNVIFYGAGNSEANYTTFIGYRDINPVNNEMANTSLFLVRMTSLTYYAMSIILILRTVILWFLLVVSPFLALLMPFVFIRNTGWIWIGVFFQWVFYGPLLSLFLATLTRVWVSGIPYPFDFSRVDKPEGQVYRTAINILYGGPAQTLGPGNTANYVDTYAEYVIALIMLWAAIILPWWLLRIFRDYCCSLLASGNATLGSILDRIRQYPPPPPPAPAGPTTTSGMAAELPFRQRIEEKFNQFQTKKVEEYRTVSLENTSDIARSIDMSISTLSDISRMEMDKDRRVQVKDSLNKLAAPEKITSSIERERYASYKSKLESKAKEGDVIAKTILNASQGEQGLSSNIEMMVQGRSAVAGGVRRGTFAPSVPQVLPVGQVDQTSKVSQSTISSITRDVNLSETKVMEILSGVQSLSSYKSVPVTSIVAQKTGVSESKVREVMDRVHASASKNNTLVSDVSKVSNLSETKVREIIELLGSQSAVSVSDQMVSSISQKSEVSESKIRDVMDRVHSSSVVDKTLISDISSKSGISVEKVKEVVSELTAVSTISSQSQIIKSVAEKTGVTEDKVKEVMQASMAAQAAAGPGRTEAAKVHVKPNIPVTIAGQKVETQVSVEDYEEVKKMWLNHYREAPVPITEMIKDRPAWLVNEETTLTNISNLLASSDVKQRQKGLEQVAEILPFMLLGGFSDAEILTYVKAKLEAVKQVQSESEIEKKAREEVKKEKEEEDTLVEVKGKKEEEKEEASQSESKEMELPEQKDKKKS